MLQIIHCHTFVPLKVTSVDLSLGGYVLVACGKEGIFKVAVCVAMIVSPFGRRTSNGVVVDCLLEHLAFFRIKCAVHPESKSAVHDDG
jgi:hypothetical protein